MKRHCGGNLRPKRVHIHTLGCPKNVVDSETFAGILHSAGYEYVSQPHRADVLVINTCGFLDDAKIESIEMMLEGVRWKGKQDDRRLYAMGCLTQRDGVEVRDEIPELDGVFGIGEWSNMLTAMGANPLTVEMDGQPATQFAGAAGPGSAYLRISDGCSHACAFCAIPQMRGLYRSERMEDLVRDARILAQRGVRELILVGQETTSYGVDLYRERKIVELCQRLSEIEGIHWLRLLYAHPPSTPPYLMEQLARVPKLAPYIDFPIEHASDRMLKRMNRRTSAARMKKAIAAFRGVRPDACVRTTVLVGFPGEMEDDFDELYHFMEEVRFERAGVFVYSPQEGTAGATLSDRVEEGIALDRLDRLMTLQRRICIEKHRRLLGSSIEVIIDRTARGVSWGRSAWDAPDIDGRVRVSGDHAPGTIVTVTVRKSSAYQLDAEPDSAVSFHARGEICGSFSLPVLSQP